MDCVPPKLFSFSATWTPESGWGQASPASPPGGPRPRAGSDVGGVPQGSGVGRTRTPRRDGPVPRRATSATVREKFWTAGKEVRVTKASAIPAATDLSLGLVPD